jgi:hypothetical protein
MTTKNQMMIDFVEESWRIEGLTLSPVRLANFVAMHQEFIAKKPITVEDLILLAAQFTDGYGRLRNKPGMDVYVGSHTPPSGGPQIRVMLNQIIHDLHFRTPYQIHCSFESLHPFLDGNGRTGRALWLWQMGGHSRSGIGFLHEWYYQSLSNLDSR